jgi:hypothetical protein
MAALVHCRSATAKTTLSLEWGLQSLMPSSQVCCTRHTSHTLEMMQPVAQRNRPDHLLSQDSQHHPSITAFRMSDCTLQEGPQVLPLLRGWLSPCTPTHLPGSRGCTKRWVWPQSVRSLPSASAATCWDSITLTTGNAPDDMAAR